MAAVQPKGKAAKFGTIGDTITIQVTAPVTEQQATTYVPGGRGEPKFFPSGDPIMDQVISGLDVNAASEEEAPSVIYVDKQAMRRAIGVALQAAGSNEIAVGSTLQVTFSGFGVGKNPANPPKDFTVQYWAPQATGGAWGAPA